MLEFKYRKIPLEAEVILGVIYTNINKVVDLQKNLKQNEAINNQIRN